MDSKKAYICSLPLTLEVILSFVSSQVVSLMQQSKKEDEPYVPSMISILLVILYMDAQSYVDLGLPLPPVHFLPVMTKNVRIYMETAIVVVISYLSLLVISWSYIWLVLFPIIAIGFIVALCNEFRHQDHHGGSHEQSNQGEEGEEATRSPAGKKQGLEAVALLPYWALCMMGQSFEADKFAVSQFLLFLSFMLGALTMMMTRLVGLAATTAHRGIAPASEVLRKASLVVLLVAVHAVAAELLGENALLFCLPEIVPVLLWLSVGLDCDGRDGITAADRIKLDLSSRVLILLRAAPAAIMAILAAGYMDESVLYWCGKALVSCAVSVPLTFYVVFMLCQWPGGQPSLQEAVKLLRFWARVLLEAVVTLLVFTSLASVQLVLMHEPVTSASVDQIRQKFLQFIIQP